MKNTLEKYQKIEKLLKRFGCQHVYYNGNENENFFISDYLIMKTKNDIDMLLNATENPFHGYEKHFPNDFTNYTRYTLPTEKEINAAIKKLAGKNYGTPVAYNLTENRRINARFLKALIETLKATEIYIDESEKGKYKPFFVHGKNGKAVICGIITKKPLTPGNYETIKKNW